MTPAEWRPLSNRLEGGSAATAWRSEVPAGLVKPLRDWIAAALRPNAYAMASGMQGLAERVLLRLDLVLPPFEPGGQTSRMIHQSLAGMSWREAT